VARPNWIATNHGARSVTEGQSGNVWDSDSLAGVDAGGVVTHTFRLPVVLMAIVAQRESPEGSENFRALQFLFQPYRHCLGQRHPGTPP